MVPTYIECSIKTKSISLICDIFWLNLNDGKWKFHVEKSHETPRKEQFINNDYGLINIRTNIITSSTSSTIQSWRNHHWKEKTSRNLLIEINQI